MEGRPSPAREISTKRRAYNCLMPAKFACVAVLLIAVGCASADSESTMEGAMKALVGRNLADVIAEKSVFPESKDLLPNGNTVYRFAHGFGGSFDRFGHFTSNVCKVWLEAKPDGTIVRWRYEN